MAGCPTSSSAMSPKKMNSTINSSLDESSVASTVSDESSLTASLYLLTKKLNSIKYIYVKKMDSARFVTFYKYLGSTDMLGQFVHL